MSDRVRAVYDGCYRRLVAQVYALTADLAEAQDAVQEAFVRALAQPRAFERVDNPEAWLRVVALNVARRRFRRRVHLDRLLRRPVATRPITPDGLSADHVALVAALRLLPAPQREAIALHHLADLPVAEIAELTGVAVGTVKTRLARGRPGEGRGERCPILTSADCGPRWRTPRCGRPSSRWRPGPRPAGGAGPA